MVLMFRMSQGVLFITGVPLGLTTIILTFLDLGLLSGGIIGGQISKISFFLAVILRESFSFPFSSSAALPACRASFIGATNGSTGEAYTCTSLSP